MLDGEFQTAHARKGALEFLLDIVFIIGELSAQVGAYLLFLPIILHDADMPEHNDAVDIQRPFAVLAPAFIHYAIADLIAGSDGVDLMPDLRAVKIQLVILFAVPVIHRNAVGIARYLRSSKERPSAVR